MEGGVKGAEAARRLGERHLLPAQHRYHKNTSKRNQDHETVYHQHEAARQKRHQRDVPFSLLGVESSNCTELKRYLVECQPVSKVWPFSVRRGGRPSEVLLFTVWVGSLGGIARMAGGSLNPVQPAGSPASQIGSFPERIVMEEEQVPHKTQNVLGHVIRYSDDLILKQKC